NTPYTRLPVTNLRAASRLHAFTFAVSIVLVAAVLRLAADPWLGRTVPYLLYYPAVMFAAWYGGFWPGMLATALSGLVAWYWYLGPVRSFTIRDPGELLSLIVFILTGALIARLHETLRRAQKDQKQLAAIVHSSGDAIVGKNLNGIVTSWNTG